MDMNIFHLAKKKKKKKRKGHEYIPLTIEQKIKIKRIYSANHPK
jgi:hypothetical protein